jgi:hypothetical protein
MHRIEQKVNQRIVPVFGAAQRNILVLDHLLSGDHVASRMHWYKCAAFWVQVGERRQRAHFQIVVELSRVNEPIHCVVLYPLGFIIGCAEMKKENNKPPTLYTNASKILVSAILWLVVSYYNKDMSDLTIFQLMHFLLSASRIDTAHIVPVTLFQKLADWFVLPTRPQDEPKVANWRLALVGPGCSQNYVESVRYIQLEHEKIDSYRNQRKQSCWSARLE